MEARRRSWSRNDSDGLGPGRWRTRQCRTRRPVCRANLRKGQEAADGSATAATVIRYRRDNSRVIIDIGGGYGGGVVLRLKDNGIEPTSFNGANESTEKTKDGQLTFANKRAEAWWKFREALDPDQPDGSAIALPADPELRADLCAPTWKLTARGILLESKTGSSGFGNLRQRLGRSPGRGDAEVMAWSQGNAAAVSRQAEWKWKRDERQRWIV
jgi:hypothetical protein